MNSIQIQAVWEHREKLTTERTKATELFYFFSNNSVRSVISVIKSFFPNTQRNKA